TRRVPSAEERVHRDERNRTDPVPLRDLDLDHLISSSIPSVVLPHDRGTLPVQLRPAVLAPRRGRDVSASSRAIPAPLPAHPTLDGPAAVARTGPIKPVDSRVPSSLHRRGEAPLPQSRLPFRRSSDPVRRLPSLTPKGHHRNLGGLPVKPSPVGED